MILSEKEILNAFDAFALDMGEGVNGIDYSISEKVLKEFVHTIVQNVVWEGGAVVKHEYKWEDGNLIITAGLHFDEIGPGWLLNVPDGQCVLVTITPR